MGLEHLVTERPAELKAGKRLLKCVVKGFALQNDCNGYVAPKIELK